MFKLIVFYSLVLKNIIVNTCEYNVTTDKGV